jgi:zeaxanthin glucosyltransferase
MSTSVSDDVTSHLPCSPAGPDVSRSAHAVDVNAWENTDVSRFLFVILPVTSHLNPALAIADALLENGHDVAWCGAESDLRPLVGPAATVYPTGKRAYRQYAESGMAAARVLWDGYLIPVNRFILPAADRAVADDRPDVVVADQYALAGALAALRNGARWATLCTGAMELTPPAELPGLAAWVRAQLARVWAMTDLPADEAIDLRFSPHLVIALTTSALTGAAPLPASCVLVGPALGRRPPVPGFAWDEWDPDRRHVLVTVGTASEHMASDFYARTVLALEPMAGRLQPVLVASADLVPDPPRRALTAARVPMLDLLPRLDAAICHGGMGTVTEALAHGVPLVLAPMRHDQPVVARQVAQAGAGVEVSFKSATPADIADAVRAVLEEPGYRASARRIADSFAAAGGARAAAAHLAALATGGQAGAEEHKNG